MKNKLLKTGFLSLLLMFGLTNIVHAEKANVCTTYNNYYLFNEINTKKYVEDEIKDNNGTWITRNATYFPSIPENAVAPKNNEAIISHRVCLKKGDLIDGTDSICKNNTWTLEEFYKKELFIANNPTTVDNLKISDDESTSYSYISEEGTDADGKKEITTYYKHGRWFVVDAEYNSIEEGGNAIDYINTYKNDISALVNGSFLPQTSLTMTDTTVSPIKGVAERKIESTDIDSVVPFEVDWNGTKKESVLSPALYQIKYTLCEEKDVYKAQIDYVYTDGSEAAPSHNEDELEAGYTNKVTSPTIKNCTPDKENVTISIDKDNPEDFYEKVIYTCKTDKEANNPKTGSALIFVAWVVGIGALGYAVYYFTKLKKSKAE